MYLVLVHSSLARRYTAYLYEFVLHDTIDSRHADISSHDVVSLPGYDLTIGSGSYSDSWRA